MSKITDIEHDRVAPAGPRLPSLRKRSLANIPSGEMPVKSNSLDPQPIPPHVGPLASRSLGQSVRTHRHAAGRDVTRRPSSPSSSSVLASSVPSHVLLALDTSDFNRSLSIISTTSQMSPVSTTHTIQPAPRTVSDAGYQGREPRSRMPREELSSTSAGHSRTRSSLLSGPLRPHNLSLPGSNSRKLSAASVDRDAGAHLDLKRLLSKPAVQATSSSSVMSLPLDSEHYRSSGPTHALVGDAVARLRSHKPSIERLPVGGGPSGSHSSSYRPESRDTSASRDVAHEQGSKAARNVLRRKVSARRGSALPGSDAQASGSGSLLHHISGRHRMRSSEGLSADRSRRPATSPSYTVSTSLMTAPAPPGLTPAGAVVHAYKQQEQRRGALVEFSDSGEQTARAKEGLDLDTGRVHAASARSSPQEEPSSGPYYTVFGSSSEHVAAANVQDTFWHIDGYVGSEEHARKQSNANTLPRRSLSRKMSGKLKHIVRRDKDASPFEVVAEPEARGRDSWRLYDGPRPPKERSESIPLSGPQASMNNFVNVVEQREHSRRSIPTARNGGPQKSEAEHGLRTVTLVKGKDREVDEDSPTGGKWWKLVKRISAGGLRDKYRTARDSTPPPVPALPADFQKLASARMTLEIPKSSTNGEANEDDVLLSRFMQSRSSLSGVRPSPTSSHKKYTTASRPSTGTGKGSTSSAPRPSTTTTSSSPVSSDPASSRFFQRSHSARSSTSSYGAEVPPMPMALKTSLGQNIMSPSALERLHAEEETDVVAHIKPRKPNRANSAPADDRAYLSSGDESVPSLPAPRRPPRNGLRPPQSLRDSPSPTIPSFSTEHAVNNFSTPSLPLSEFGTTAFAGAVARPKRNDNRRQLNISVPSAAVSSQTLRAPATPRTPRPATSSRTSSTDALSFASTARQPSVVASKSKKSPSVSGSTVSSPPMRSPMTFRELESPRQAWSEQEKTEKWEALLERSNRAGGTIHIGEPGLLSEDRRLSQYSEA